MLSKTLAGTLGAGLLALGVATSAAPAQAATFTVNTTDNGGPGSLRSAILAAEDTLRRDRIEFAIPGNGVHTIALDTDLPVLTRPLTIKGYSQNGSSPATGTTAAAPKIVIDAANALRGLDVGGDEMEIRGLVVKNAEAAGIFVEGRENVIAGNHVGTNAAGTAARGNGGDGITVVGRDNVIGGSDPEDRNVISGNLGGEVAVTDGTGNVIEGNRIGTNAAGTAGFGGAVGVELESAGTTVRDNLISDHGFAGVTVTGDDNTLQGNDVGTKRSGKRALANGFGILVQGGDANLIGGTAEGEGNLVSGNLHAGIRLDRSDDDPAVGNDVQGNLIGTTSTGRAPLPNGAFGGYPGVSVVASNANTIGGSAPGAGNVISANAGDGVYLRDGADDNQVLGNAIGTNRTGRRELGNGGSGVFIADGDANRVGDDQDGTPVNTITHNGDDGVTVAAGVANAVVRNAISGNDDLGIDLGADGSTANDPSDLDAGANDLQNGPEIDEVTRTTAEWALETQPQTQYRLEFYTCDGPGTGEGQTFLGSILTTTDANGDADETTPLPARVRPGQHVTMTATRAALTGLLGTSEFAPCEEVGS